MPIQSKTLVKDCSLASLLIAILSTTAAPLLAEDSGEKQPREQIGESLGKPVYRDEIRTDKNVTLTSELHRLFTVAAGDECRSEHEKEITPTPTEISAARKFSIKNMKIAKRSGNLNYSIS